MRFAGLAICLLVSSMGARAESLEDRVAALEARVKSLEQALRTQGSQGSAPKQPTMASIEGVYQTFAPTGEKITLEFSKGHIVASFGNESKAGTYEIIGDHVAATIEGKTEVLTIDGNHLKAENSKDKIDLVKVK